MSVSLLEAKANFVEWCKSFLNTHVDYKKDMPFDIDFVAKAIWKKIENSYENLLYLEEQNVALRGEADTNAALSIKHKMLAYELKAENAALRERLEKAVELPCKIGDRFYIVEYYPPEIIEEECCDFSFIELSKILLDNGCGVTYELGDNGCFFVTLDKNEAIRIYNQKKEEQND